MDLQHLGVGKYLVTAAHHARVHRTNVERKGGSPQRLARSTPAAPSACLRVAHGAMIGRNRSVGPTKKVLNGN